MLLDIKNSILIICDVQENNATATISPRMPINGSAALLKSAIKLNIPYIITEINPKIIGKTIFDIRTLASPENIFIKDTFSAIGTLEILNKIKSYDKKQAVICGVETHINVMQTAIDISNLNMEAFVPLNACSVRDDVNTQATIYRMLSENIRPTSVENVITEWLRKPNHPAFKELLFR